MTRAKSLIDIPDDHQLQTDYTTALRFHSLEATHTSTHTSTHISVNKDQVLEYGCNVQSKSVDERSQLQLQSSSDHSCRSSRQSGAQFQPVSSVRKFYLRHSLTETSAIRTTVALHSQSPEKTLQLSRATPGQHQATTSTHDTPRKSSR